MLANYCLLNQPCSRNVDARKNFFDELLMPAKDIRERGLLLQEGGGCCAGDRLAFFRLKDIREQSLLLQRAGLFFQEGGDEIVQAVRFDGVAQALHQVLIETQVVHGHQAGTKNFIAAIKVP